MVVAAVLFSGCTSQKLLDTQAEIAGAKARIASLQKRRAELDAKRKELLASKETLSQQADRAELERQRLWAALAVLNGGQVPDGIRLDEAMRAKDPKLDALAAEIIQRQLPCDDGAAAEEDEEHEHYDECGPPPLDDACEGVEKRTNQTLSWSCSDFVTGAGVPPAVICTAGATWESRIVPEIGGGDGDVDTQLVRIAFEKNGHVYVRDWPPPSVDLYRPPNTGPLAACEAENATAQCVRSCDEKYGRAGGCGDGYGDYYEGEHEDEENPDPPELIEARRAAAEAEAQAESARNELAYQECLAPCHADEEVPESPLPKSVDLSFAMSPAVGVFVFDVKEQDLNEADAGVVETRSIVLEHPDLFEAASGKLEGEENTVAALTAILDVEHLQIGEPSNGTVTLAGLDRDKVAGVKVAVDGKTPSATLSADDACGFIAARKKVPKALTAACARRPAPALPAAATDAGQKEGTP